MAKQPEKVDIVRTHHFSKSYGTRILVSATQFDFRLLVCNERIKMTGRQGEKEAIVAETMTILTPQATLELYKGLKIAIKEYESKYDKITPRIEEESYVKQEL